MPIFLGKSEDPISLVVRFYKNFDTGKPSKVMRVNSTIGIMNKQLPYMFGTTDLDTKDKPYIYFGYQDYEIENIADMCLKMNPENTLPKSCYNDPKNLKNFVITGTIHSSVPITKGDLSDLILENSAWESKKKTKTIKVKKTPSNKEKKTPSNKEKKTPSKDKSNSNKKIKMKIVPKV